MRVAFDARPLMAQRTGIGRYVEGILDGLLKHEELKEFLLFSPRDIELSHSHSLRADPRVVSHIRQGWKGNVWLQVVLPFLLKKYNPDLFHATLYLPPVFNPCHSVVNIYDLVAYRYPQAMQWKNCLLLRALLPRAVFQASRIITLSEFIKQEVETRWPETLGKISVIPGAPYIYKGAQNDSDDIIKGDALLRRYGIRPPFFLYAGTLEPRKNIERMLKAFALCHKMGETAPQLVLVGGKGWGMKKIRQTWEASPVRQEIRWIGYVPDDVLAQLYKRAALFIYVSLYEGFGFPPLEAMASGTCVVASDRGSLPEVLGGAAALVDPLNVENIARTLVTLSSDEGLRSAYEQKGLIQAGKYSWEKSARETFNVYKDLK